MGFFISRENPVFGCGIFDLPASVEKAREFCDSGFSNEVGNPCSCRLSIPEKEGSLSFGLALNMLPGSCRRNETAALFSGCPLAAVSSIPAADIPDAEKAEYGGYPGRYILLDSPQPDRQSLSTPVAAYVHDNGMEVALIGAIHVAEPEYYDWLNKLFRRYDVLLFEMIGGEGLRREEGLCRTRLQQAAGGAELLEEAREWNRIVEWRKKCGQEETEWGCWGAPQQGVEQYAGTPDPASGH